jgi:aspartate aminotransferase
MIAKRASDIAPSLTLAITAKAKKMKAEGIDVTGFGAGEPDFNTPDYIIAAAKAALDAGYTKYTPSAGIPPLRRAIAEKFAADNGITYSPAQIVVSNGAKHSLFNACQAIVEPNDEVIIPAPYWLTYPELVRLSGGVPVFVHTREEDGFKLTARALKGAITARTKALILNSPSNPTGAVYTREELSALGAVIEDAGIYAISDEIYEKLVYGGACHTSLAALSAGLRDKTITVNGFSKTYAMTGWRIGYLGAPPDIAAAIDNMQSHTTSNAGSIGQYAALAALGGGAEFLKTLVATFDGRRKYTVKRVNEMPRVSAPVPDGAFYVMMNIGGIIGGHFAGEEITGAQRAAELLLEHARVAAVPGEAFGADGYLRLSYAISAEEIEKGLDKIEKFLKGVT